jgi:hypothetical protein
MRRLNSDRKVSRINSDFEFVPLKIHSKEVYFAELTVWFEMFPSPIGRPIDMTDKRRPIANDHFGIFESFDNEPQFSKVYIVYTLNLRLSSPRSVGSEKKGPTVIISITWASHLC